MSWMVNLTPHELTIRNIDTATPEVIPPSGDIARVAQIVTPAGLLGSSHRMAVRRREFGAIEGLPEPHGSTVYIVSALVLNALDAAGSDRTDVFSPGEPIRDAEGKIVGADGLYGTVAWAAAFEARQAGAKVACREAADQRMRDYIAPAGAMHGGPTGGHRE